MPFTLVRNPGASSITLPYPYRGMLGPGEMTVAALSVSTITAALAGTAPLTELQLTELADNYAGPVDSFRFQSIAPGAVTAADVGYDDDELPAFGETDVQGALDAVKTLIADVPTLAAGTYAPTVASVTPVDLSTSAAANFRYIRVGSNVKVSGVLTVVAGSLNADSEIDVSIPIASADISTLSGLCAGNTLPAPSGDALMVNGMILPSGGNARLYFTMAFANNPTTFSMCVDFTYTIA